MQPRWQNLLQNRFRLCRGQVVISQKSSKSLSVSGCGPLTTTVSWLMNSSPSKVATKAMMPASRSSTAPWGNSTFPLPTCPREAGGRGQGSRQKQASGP
jgi:hypothetical protein